jgi:hypothetical protein
MEPEKKIKTIAKHFGIGVIVPALLLINAFIVPEPYSHPFIDVAIAPTKLMPFLENRELMRELTIFVFGSFPGATNYENSRNSLYGGVGCCLYIDGD